jgi:glycolate oxidase FAD binding subunit
MADLLGTAEISLTPPPWWPGAPSAEAGATLVQVSFWVSALTTVLDAIDAAARDTGVSPTVSGSAGAGVLYVRLPRYDATPDIDAPDFAARPRPGDSAGASPRADRIKSQPEGGWSSGSGMSPVGGKTAETPARAASRVSAETRPGGSGPSGSSKSPASSDIARFVGALRSALAHERGGVAVLAAPTAVRDELVAGGEMAGSVPALSLMRAVKDQFDPGHRMAPGRFPDAI